MSELLEIIKYEKEIEQKVLQEKESAEREIEKKKDAIEKATQRASFLMPGEKEKIEKEKIEKIKELETFYQEKLTKSLLPLKQRTAKKLQEAVDKVIDILWP